MITASAGSHNILQAESTFPWARETEAASDMKLGILKGRVIRMDWLEAEIPAARFACNASSQFLNHRLVVFATL